MLKKEKKTFGDILMKIQKPVVFLCLGVFIALFVYALIFFTPFNQLYSSCDALWASGGGRGGGTPNWTNAGIDYTTLPEVVWVYNDAGTKVVNLNMTYYVRYLGKYAIYGNESIQSLNHQLFTWGLVGILVSLLLLIYRDGIRKNYYITNHVVNGAWSIFALSMAITLFVNLSYWQVKIHSMDIEMINKFRNFNNLEAFDLNSLNWIFVVGYVIAVFMIIASISLISLSICKYIATEKRKKEKAMIKEQETQNNVLVKEGE